MDGRIMSGLMSRNDRLLEASSHPGNGLACGWRKLLLPDWFGDLGYHAMSYDADLLILRPGDRDELVLRLHFRARDLQYVMLELTLAGFTGRVEPGASPEPRIEAVTLRYGLDPGYVGKALEYCARYSDLPVDELLERLAAQDDKAYMADLGFVPGPGIRSALLSYFRRPTEIRLTAHPSYPLDVRSVGRYRLQDLPARLNVSLRLDQRKVSDLSIETIDVRPPDTAGDGSRLSSRVASSARKAELNNRGGSGEIVRNGAYYQLIGKEQAGDLVGRDVWVVTSSGSERQGRVVKVEQGIVWLRLRLRGGSMTTSVALAEAEAIGLRTGRR
jgi:hypothetical protein